MHVFIRYIYRDTHALHMHACMHTFIHLSARTPCLSLLTCIPSFAYISPFTHSHAHSYPPACTAAGVTKWHACVATPLSSPFWCLRVSLWLDIYPAMRIVQIMINPREFYPKYDTETAAGHNRRYRSDACKGWMMLWQLISRHCIYLLSNSLLIPYYSFLLLFFCPRRLLPTVFLLVSATLSFHAFRNEVCTVCSAICVLMVIVRKDL